MPLTLASGLAPVRVVLGNGAVVVAQASTATPAVAINVTVGAGSAYEPPHLTGLAHLTGRVIDRGTLTRSAENIAEELDERGVSLRVTTTRHTMTVSCTCLAEDFGDVLALVMDVVRRPAFPEVELDKRRAETITALRQDEDNPAVRAVEGLSELLYGARHPYGRPAKGTPDTVDAIDRDSMAGFHAHHVRPSSLSLVVVGDVREQRAIDLAAAEIDDWAGPPAEPAVVPPCSGPDRRRKRVIPMPGKPQTDIAYGFVTIGRLDPRYYAYWMMNNILGQFGLGGRLADNIRERQGMAYYTFSSFEPSFGPAPLIVRAGVDPANVGRAVDAIDAEVRQFGIEGPTPTEVEETRAFLIGSIPRTLETNSSIAAFLQRCEHFGLGLDYDRRLPALLQAVTIDEIRSAATDALRPERAAVVIAGPHEAEP